MHDVNGKELKVGDKVSVPAKIKSAGLDVVIDGKTYTTLNLELGYPTPVTLVVVNSSQVVKAE